MRERWESDTIFETYMKTTNKEAEYFFVIVIILAVSFFVFDFYNIFIKNDFRVLKQISCDPKISSCFVSDCESNDSSCDQTTTYEKISVVSKYAGSDYDSLTCTENSSICQIITCQDSTIEAGEKCFK